jgi:imidazolonepropionase-like amidohydrolase
LDSRPWITGADVRTARILAGWLIDGTGGPVRQNVWIGVEDGNIVSVGAPEKAQLDDSRLPVLDFSGCTLLPPLIDAHVHLFMSATPDLEIRQKQLDAAYAELRPAMEGHLRALAASGVVAARDGGDYGGYALRLRDEGDRKDWVWLRAAGKAWRKDGRYGRLIGRPVPPGLSLAEAILRDDQPSDHVKLVNSGINSLKTFGRQTPPQFSSEEFREAVHAAHEQGKPVMVHANGVEPVRGAVEAGCDSIEHGFFMGGENLARMAERGTIWVPTAITMRAYAETLPADDPAAEIARRTFDHQLAQIARARELGVQIAVGTDAGSLGVEHGRAVAWEMGILVEAGFSVSEAVRCATGVGAQLLGQSDFGPIVIGTPLRFLVVEGSPDQLLEDFEKKKFVKFVLKGEERLGDSGLSIDYASPDGFRG